MQIPDSGPVGVLSAVRDGFDTFGIDPTKFPLPSNLSEFAATISALASAGYVVVLDEFQYFHRAGLSEFASHLQREVDNLTANASSIRGGLFVLGSLHTELTALLEDRDAPLYNRLTDTIEVGHLDVSSLLEILDAHADRDPYRLLMLWNLFEGVPKFYRDSYEQNALACNRTDLLRRMFFLSSAPLRNEAENWFLHELRGRYDVVLKYIARNPGCSNGDLDAHVRQVNPESAEQTGGYVKNLIERYELIERRLPIFARKKERKGRYHIRDNFLRSWLTALAPFVAAVNFQPIEVLIERARVRLEDSEGTGLERLVATLYEERSRKGLTGFSLSHRIEGYWDAQGTEIDLVAVDDPGNRIRFGTCKRDEAKLEASLVPTDGHIERFLDHLPRYRSYTIEKVAIAPVISPERVRRIESRGWFSEDLATLTSGL